jgi:hypothetical protein
MEANPSNGQKTLRIRVEVSRGQYACIPVGVSLTCTPLEAAHVETAVVLLLPGYCDSSASDTRRKASRAELAATEGTVDFLAATNAFQAQWANWRR